MSSLLNPYNIETKSEIYNSLEELQFDDLVGIIYADVPKKKKIMSLFNNVLVDESTIYYRQDVIKDFIQNRLLFSCFEIVSNLLEKTYRNYNTARGENSKGRFRTNIAFGDQRNNLIDYGQALLSLIKIYRNLNEALTKSVLKSTGLKELREKVKEKVEKDSFNKLEEVIDKIKTSAFANAFYTTIDDTLSPFKTKYIIANGKYEVKKSFFSKKKEEKNGLIEKNEQTMEDFSRMHLDAYNEIIALFEDMFESLYNSISYINEEFLFFDFTMKLHDMLDTMRVGLSFPTIGTDICYKYAIDPFLACKYIKEGYSFNVYGNDISIDNKQNIVVVGPNNTGKTVLARTIGLSQILAQNGLFVCARESSIAIKETIVSIISGEEDDSDVGGRFEKEVIEIKNIIDNVQDNCLVIVNEIFQSTFASDGRRALIDILNYFTQLNVTWVAVTHLLNSKVDKIEFIGNIKMFTTTGKENRYKLEEVINEE